MTRLIDSAIRRIVCDWTARDGESDRPMVRTVHYLAIVVLCALVLSGCNHTSDVSGDSRYQDVTMPDGFQTKMKWVAWQSSAVTIDPTTGEILLGTPIGQWHRQNYVRMPDGFWLRCANDGDCTEVYQEYLPWHKKASE